MRRWGRTRKEDKFIEKPHSSFFGLTQSNAGNRASSPPQSPSVRISFFSYIQLFSQSRVCCEIQYVSECLCALAVLYSNDLVDLPALIRREAFSTH